MSWKDRATKVETNKPSWKDRASKVEAMPEESTKLESAAGGLTQGATLGFGDELEGVLSALLRPTGLVGAGGTIGDISTASPTLDLDTIKDEYYRSRDAARERLTKQELDNPKTYGATELAGGFATPAFGAAKAIGAATKGAKGVMNAIKTGAVAGATGSAAANVGYADELKSIDPEQLAVDAGVGGLLGGAIGGTIKGVGNVAGMIADSDVGQKIGKVYNKTKEGIKLTGKEATEGFNQELLDISGKITGEVKDTAQKFKDEYSAAVKSLKIDNPEKFQKELNDLADELAEQQVRGGMIDVRTVDQTINKLRKDKRVNDDKILDLRSKIMQASKLKKEAATKASYGKAQQSIENQSVKAENLDLKKSFEDQVRTAQDELIEARRAYQDNPMDRAELKLEVRAKEDALRAVRREAKDAGFDMSDSSIKTTKSAKELDTLNRSSTDVLTQTDDLQSGVDQAMTSNIDISRQIADLIEGKQQANNSAFSGLLNQLGILGKSAGNTTLSDIKDVNLNSIRSFAEQMGRDDLVTKIDDLVKSNIGGAKNLDAKYADIMAGLNEMGLKLDNFSSSVVKNADAETQLAQKMKLAAKDPTGVAANTLRQSRDILDNQKVDQLLDKGVDVGENYNLSKDISQAGLKSFGLRGAVAAGDAANVVMNTGIARAAKRLGNSALGQKVQEVASMPEGDARTRAMFLLGQQSWFRNASKDENEK